MADSLRLQVLKALTEHLQGIVGEDWDDFDLSAAVFRGRAVFGKESPETMLSILEAPRNDPGVTAGTNGAARSEGWPLLLQGWTIDDHENPTDPLYALVDVVERRLSQIISVKARSGMPEYPDAYMLDGLISSFEYGPPIVRPATEGVSSKAFFYLPLRVGLATVV